MHSPHSSDQKISVILPAWGEEENLSVLLPRLLSFPAVGECVVVVDPHPEQDGARLDLERKFGHRLRILKNPERIGLAKSIRRGIEAAKFGRILIRDSDLNHSWADTAEFVARAEDEGMVVASRYVNGARRPRRHLDIFSAILNFFLARSYGGITDWTYGYFMFSRKLLSRAPMEWIFDGRGEYSIRFFRFSDS